MPEGPRLVSGITRSGRRAQSGRDVAFFGLHARLPGRVGVVGWWMWRGRSRDYGDRLMTRLQAGTWRGAATEAILDHTQRERAAGLRRVDGLAHDRTGAPVPFRLTGFAPGWPLRQSEQSLLRFTELPRWFGRRAPRAMAHHRAQSRLLVGDRGDSTGRRTRRVRTPVRQVRRRRPRVIVGRLFPADRGRSASPRY